MVSRSVINMGSSIMTYKVEKIPSKVLTPKEMLYWSMPHPDVKDERVKMWRRKNAKQFLGEWWKLALMLSASKISGYSFLYGNIWLYTLDGKSGEELLYGLAGLRLVTNAGRDEIVDEFDAATAAGFDLTSFNFHGIGTGVTAPAVGDTALQTELTTEYNPNSTRATGTQSQPTSDVYRTDATNTLDSGTPAVTEAGVLSQAATGGGVLLDRFTFSAINLNGANGDGLRTIVNLTLPAGS
jgi:hypothetical protein